MVWLPLRIELNLAFPAHGRAVICIEHLVLDYWDDCEVLEIILPADFETVELE